MKSIALAFSITLFSFPVFADQDFLPKGYCYQLVEKTYFSLCYEPNHRQAIWTKHELTLDQINGTAKRTNDYRADFDVLNPVEGHDYRGSGFDRGHLVPAADRKLNQEAMSETFYMTNMSPQVGKFNQGIWLAIEKAVRRQVRSLGPAHVITAPLLETDLSRIRAGVSIPNWYYKIAYYPKSQHMEAYLIENKVHPRTPLEEFQVSVDEIEALTGFDFFTELEDSLEEALESLTGR